MEIMCFFTFLIFETVIMLVYPPKFCVCKKCIEKLSTRTVLAANILAVFVVVVVLHSLICVYFNIVTVCLWQLCRTPLHY